MYKINFVYFPQGGTKFKSYNVVFFFTHNILYNNIVPNAP